MSFGKTSLVPGSGRYLNQSLGTHGRRSRLSRSFGAAGARRASSGWGISRPGHFRKARQTAGTATGEAWSGEPFFATWRPLGIQGRRRRRRSLTRSTLDYEVIPAGVQLNASNLKIWGRPADRTGRLEDTPPKTSRPNAFFLEDADVVTRVGSSRARTPSAFDRNCREGICADVQAGINGVPQGPTRHGGYAQLHCGGSHGRDTVTLGTWSAKAFPVVKDLVFDRSGLRPDHSRAGGYPSRLNAAARTAGA